MSSGEHRSSATTQKDDQTTPNRYESGYFLTQPKSQNEESKNNLRSFLEFPTMFSRMYTYPREPDDESTRSWTYRSRESDGTGRNCFVPSDPYGNNHQFPSSKKKQQDEGV